MHGKFQSLEVNHFKQGADNKIASSWQNQSYKSCRCFERCDVINMNTEIML
jgi:hypothetical protein